MIWNDVIKPLAGAIGGAVLILAFFAVAVAWLWLLSGVVPA